MQGKKSKNSEQTHQQPAQDIINIDVLIVDLWKGFKKFWWTAVLFAVVFSSVAVFKCKKDYVPMYISQASFSVSVENASTVASGASYYSTYYNSAATQQLSKTFSYIINSSTMKTILQNQLGTDELNGTITASNEVESAPIFTIKVTSPSARDAYDILNAVMENYPRLAQYVLGETQLTIFTEPKIPSEPMNAFSYKKYLSTALMCALLLSFAVTAVYAFTRNTVRKRSDVKEKLNKNCLVEVPVVKRNKRSGKKEELLTVSKKYPEFSEAFRYLSRRITTLLEKNNEKIVAFTSALPEEGKTTVVYNLAYSLAMGGKKVCLIDFDILTKKLQKALSRKSEPLGVSEYLNSQCSVKEIFNDTKIENFKIVFAGTQKIEEQNFKLLGSLMNYAKKEFDYIFIDTAPYIASSQMSEVFAQADEAVFTVSQDYASIKNIRHSIKFVHDMGCDIAGVVLNKSAAGFSGYGDGYYSNYAYQSGKYGYYGKRYGYGGNYGYSKKNGKYYGYNRYGSENSDGSYITESPAFKKFEKEDENEQ